MKNKFLKIILIILISIAILVTINFYSMKNDNNYKNTFYSENISKINDEDFSIGKISLNMSMQEVKELLGEPKDVSEFFDSENSAGSYKRFDYENLIIQFDYEKEYVNYIASSQIENLNNRGISVGDTVTDILKSYYAEKNIEVYENTYGTYEILYGKEDAIEYIKNMDSENKTFAYIYKYNDDINSIIFVENGKVIEFYLTENKINMIIVAEKYIPW